MDDDTKDWTLMFYFASDGPLAPGIVSQLKAIKDAGFHQRVNVVVRFDPHTELTPTHIFDVNLVNKLKEYPRSDVGFTDNDPYIRNLVADKLWGTETDSKGNSIRERVKKSVDAAITAEGIEYNPPIPPPDALPKIAVSAQASTLTKEPDPYTSLDSFLQFCGTYYRSEHYMLFILGHGSVVGNDIFLLDEHADGKHSLTLAELRTILERFVECAGSKLELISFHSCSVSSLEVAYELKNTANFMLASQGPAFVGSWPYRQILIRIFNDFERYGKAINIKTMARKIFDYCLYNSYDFQLAGYSFDVCLSDLTKLSDEITPSIKTSLNKLSERLIEGLNHRLAKQLILLAHWEAQSYWMENYTDLYDFCFLLNRNCAEYVRTAPQATGKILQDIMGACKDMAKVLRRGVYGADDHLIVRCEFAGPAHQYSRGFSIYFPWSAPIASDLWEKQYGYYALMQEGAEKTATNSVSWKKFLDAYFKETRRQTHAYELAYPEEQDLEEPVLRTPNPDAQLLEEITALLFNESGQLRSGTMGPAGSKDPVGDDCDCPSVKNHPRFTRSSPNFFDLLEFN